MNLSERSFSTILKSAKEIQQIILLDERKVSKSYLLQIKFGCSAQETSNFIQNNLDKVIAHAENQ